VSARGVTRRERDGERDGGTVREKGLGKETTDRYPTRLQPFTVAVSLSLSLLLALIASPRTTAVASANPAVPCNYLKTSWPDLELFHLPGSHRADRVSLCTSKHDELFRNFCVLPSPAGWPDVLMQLPRSRPPGSVRKMGAIII